MDNVHAPYHYCHDGIECKDAMRAMMGEQVGYSSMLYGGVLRSNTYGDGRARTV